MLHAHCVGTLFIGIVASLKVDRLGDLRTYDVYRCKAECRLNGDRAANADGNGLVLATFFERENLTEGTHIHPRFASNGGVIVTGWNRRFLGFLFAGDGVHACLKLRTGLGTILQ